VLCLLLLFGPVFASYAVVGLKDAVLYTNPAKVTPAVQAHLKEAGVAVKPYDALVGDVKSTAAAKGKVAMDLSKVRVAQGCQRL
jgi:Xaa-Pro aminopeptidase